MSDEQIDGENEGEEEGQTRAEKRLKFYEKHIDELIIDKKMPPLKNEFLTRLAKLCNTNVKAEHVALSRYAKKKSFTRCKVR